MLLILSVLVVSILIGLALGGRPGRLLDLRLHWWGLAVAALALQFAPVPDISAGRWIALGLLLTSEALLITFVVRNIRITGFPLVLIGLVLNVLVITVNGGMPVSRDAVIRSGQPEVLAELEANDTDAKHELESGHVLLPFLGDVIPVGPPIAQVVSVGDIVFYAGIAWFLIAAMRNRSERPQEASA